MRNQDTYDQHFLLFHSPYSSLQVSKSQRGGKPWDMEPNTALPEFHWGGTQGPRLPGRGGQSSVRPMGLPREMPGADPKNAVPEMPGKRHKTGQQSGCTQGDMHSLPLGHTDAGNFQMWKELKAVISPSGSRSPEWPRVHLKWEFLPKARQGHHKAKPTQRRQRPVL